MLGVVSGNGCAQDDDRMGLGRLAWRGHRLVSVGAEDQVRGSLRAGCCDWSEQDFDQAAYLCRVAE
ncbi:MAG TPA: hypothetical protein VFG30_40785, partial [Polyangiales bacterium]|nr:hypothetical protein [Polyangiales bacterium]